MKNKIRDLLTITGVNNKDELTDKLLTLFEAEKKKYALEMCKSTIDTIDNNFITYRELEPSECYEQFIPSQLTQENGNGE